MAVRKSPALAMTARKSPKGYDAKTHCGGAKRSGGLCTQPKGWGTRHLGVGSCKLHGGSTVTHERSGQLVKAQQLADRLAIPVRVHPYVALTDALAIGWGYAEHFRQEVVALDPESIYVRPTSILRRPLKEEKGAEEPGVVVEEITSAPLELNLAIRKHKEWLEYCWKLSKDIASLNIDERLAKVQEAKDDREAIAIHGLLEDLGITLDKRVLGFVRKRWPEAIDATAEEM
jgi:hypothetical protein